LPGARYDGLLLSALLFIGLVLRIIYTVEFSHTPFYRYPILDARYYHELALQVAQGRLIGERAFFMGPLYPYLLGFVYFLFGPGLLVPRLLQILLGLANCVLVFLIGRRVFGRAVALVAAGLLALYKPEIFYEQTLLMEVLAGSLGLVAVYLILLADEQHKMWMWVVVGGVLGLAALTRANVLLFVPFVLVWCFLRKGNTSSARSVKQRLGICGLVVLGVIAGILPGTVHNFLAEHDFVLTTSNAGFNFYIGNNEKAKGKFLIPMNVDMDNDPSGARIAERTLGREVLTSSEVSAFWNRQAINFIRNKPGVFLKLVMLKFYYFWGREEIPQIYDLKFMAGLTPLLRWPLVGYALLSPLAILGIVLALVYRSRAKTLLMLFALAYVVSIIPFFITSRYRIPVVPFLALFAASALVIFIQALMKRKIFGPAAMTAGFVVLLVVLNNSGIHDPIVEEAQFRNNLGMIHQHLGEPEKAQKEFERSLRLKPLPNAAANLGTLFFDDYHDMPKAIYCYEKAVELNPENARMLFNLGQAYLRAGEEEKAMHAYEKALSLDPKVSPLAWYNLAVLYAGKGLFAKAYVTIQTYLHDHPEDMQAFNLSIKYLIESGELGKAEAALRERIAQYPQNAMLHYNLGVVYHRQGALEKARAAYEQALQLDPDNPVIEKALKALTQDTSTSSF
jgi:tetratricopeptide (TPR) repeat protein